jgi:hypothetical protein
MGPDRGGGQRRLLHRQQRLPVLRGAPQIAIFLGVITAMLTTGTTTAIVIAALLPALPELVSPPFRVFDRPVSATLLVQTVVLASASVYGGRELRRHWPERDAQIVRALAATLVAVLLVNLWIPLVVAGTDPLVGTTSADR